MQMINVLTRLAALDGGNSNVVNPMSKPVARRPSAENVPQLPELKSLNELQALSGVKRIDECGPMGMMGDMGHSTPASFSINASASNGDEVASMLTQIMNLAGVHKSDSPMGGKEPLGVEPDDVSAMKAMSDKLNPPEDENTMMPATAPTMSAPMASTGSYEDETSPNSGGPIAAMADEVRGMADELAQSEKDDLNIQDSETTETMDVHPMRRMMDMISNEVYSNTPNDPTDIPDTAQGTVDYNANAGGHNKGVTNQPSAFAENLEEKLFAEYKSFVSEAKGKCCCEEKGKTKCPVHGKVDEEREMTRAAKGVMKYGKQGMKALADAGKAGKDLEPVRAKYNKYDEASHQASTTMKHVKNPTAGEKKAAKDIKPGVAGYKDRVAMLKSAEAGGRLK